ncbi:ABC transporter permease [Angustibacter aerolatus]
MRPYPTLAVAGFRRFAAYRAATAAGAVTNTVFGFVKGAIAGAAVAGAGGAIAGYTREGAQTNAWLVQGLLAAMALFGWSELADRIRTGDVAIDLARPVDLQLAWLAQDLGRAAFVLLPRGLPPVLVGALTTGLELRAPGWQLAVAVPSIVLGVAISFAGRFLMNLAAFWLLDVRGVVTLYVVVSTVFSGLIIPVHWFPGWLGTVADCTPFPSILQAPVDVIQGRVQGAQVAQTLLLQVGWLLVTMLAGRVVLARATAKLVVQGG